MAAVFRIIELITAVAAAIYVLATLYAFFKGRGSFPQRGKWLPVLLLSLLPSIADAACSGSGLSWTCTAGSTAGQVDTAVNSASDTATITFNAGTYSFIDVELSGRNGISMVCQTEGGCIMSGSWSVFTITGCPADRTNLMQISGFKFTGTATGLLWIYCTFNITKLRIDHNEFDTIGDGNIAIWVGEGGDGPPFADRGKVYGVIDHNYCHAPAYNFVCLHNTSGGDVWTTGNVGSGNALFFEDNRCIFGARADLTKACVDNWRAHTLVARFNTLTGSNLRGHSYCHYGPEGLEFYGNDINTASVFSPGSWDIHFQGSGEQWAWGNLVSAISGGLHPIGTQSYRSDSGHLPQGDCLVIADGTQTGVGTPADPNDGNRVGQFGYPYWHQPGRDGAATLKPNYSFLNRTRGTGAIDHLFMDTGIWTGLSSDCANNDNDRVNCHYQLNRDIYRETASFTGATGVGVGTLAARPSTCTPTPEAADAGHGGVGYWATDQGSWNQSLTNPYGVQQNGADGVFYRCSATNTWIVAYTPYTYPHPLQGFVPPAGTTTVLGMARLLSLLATVGEVLIGVRLAWAARGLALTCVLALGSWSVLSLNYVKPLAGKTLYASKALTAKAILTVLPKKGSDA